MVDKIIMWLGPVAAPFIVFAIAYLCWGIVSGLFMTIYDKRLPHTDEEWAALFQRSPRLAAAIGLLKTAGWNLPGILRSLRAFFGGGFPPAIKAILLGRAITSSTDAKTVVRDAAGELVSEVKTTVRESVTVRAIPPPPPISGTSPVDAEDKTPKGAA